MRRIAWVLTGFAGMCFSLQVGCQRAAKPDEFAGGKIVFEETVHDFGKVKAGTECSHEFKFINTGDSPLEISKVSAACGCTSYGLAKKQYAPGESGVLGMRYRATGAQDTRIEKHLYVYSNDKIRPKTKITMKAHIVSLVSFKPERLELALKEINGGCPDIMLSSSDGQAFSIEQFNSTGNCIFADFDPLLQAKEFFLRPKVNMEQLQQISNGAISIRLTHPECKTIVIFFNVVD